MAKLKRIILVDTGVEIPVVLNYEGVDYELAPDAEVPEDMLKKFINFSQYEEYNEKNKKHVELKENKDTLFVTRNKYRTFEIEREIELLSPSQRDEVVAFIKELKNPTLKVDDINPAVTDEDKS